MNKNLDTSTSSSQKSLQARPITLNFSDDDEDNFEIHNQADSDKLAMTSSESFTHIQNYDSFSSPERGLQTFDGHRKSSCSNQVDNSVDPCSGEISDYGSTPLSSRSFHNKSNLHGSNSLNASSTSKYNDAESSDDATFEEIFRSSCPETTNLNNAPDTPKVKKQHTPGSARYRSRMLTVKGSTDNIMSPKKRLNFDGLDGSVGDI